MKFNSPYWSNKVKVELLQRWILVHSFLYYELNYNVVSDSKFDSNCEQLRKLKDKYPNSYKKAKYSYAMKDFDGSTGFGFVEKLNADHHSKVARDAVYLKDKY